MERLQLLPPGFLAPEGEFWWAGLEDPLSFPDSFLTPALPDALHAQLLVLPGNRERNSPSHTLSKVSPKGMILAWQGRKEGQENLDAAKFLPNLSV